jgi:hypothetical protein
MSFATLVLIDDATAENLVSFVATTIGNEEGKAFAESCNKLIESRKGVELVAAILSKSDVVMALEDDNGKCENRSHCTALIYEWIHLGFLAWIPYVNAFTPTSVIAIDV